MWTGEELSLRGVSRDFFANPCPGEDKLRQRVAARIAANRHGKVVRVRLQDEQTVTFHDLVRAESDLSKADAPTQEELAVKRMRVTALTEVLRRHEANAEALRTQRKALTQLLKAVIRGKGRAGMIEAVPDGHTPGRDEDRAQAAGPALGRQTSAPAAPGHDRTHTPRRSWDSRDFRGRSWR